MSAVTRHVRGASILALSLALFELACSSRHRLGRIETDETADSPGAGTTPDSAASGGGAAGTSGAGAEAGHASDDPGEFVVQ